MLWVIGLGLGAGAGVGLHALGAARRSMRAVVLVSVAYVVCAVIGALEGGADGTMRGTAVATWLGIPLFWWELRAALRDSGEVPSSRFWLGRPPGRHRKARMRPVRE
jgi:hypothetical protein